MFVSFTKTLKKMSGFRLGFAMRVNKRNALLWCCAMLFAAMFYLMWYMIIGAGWCLYFMLWAIYKIYFYMFKGIAIGCKKLYQHITKKADTPEAPADREYQQTETPIEAPKEAPAASSPAPADDSPYEFIRTKIAGVTFKDGRKSRQTILRRLYWKDEPFNKNAAEVTLERGEYEGKPAFAVMLNGEKAGYVPAERAQFVEDNFDRCDGVTHIEAYCGKNDIYGAEIIIRFRKI